MGQSDGSLKNKQMVELTESPKEWEGEELITLRLVLSVRQIHQSPLCALYGTCTRKIRILSGKVTKYDKNCVER